MQLIQSPTKLVQRLKSAGCLNNKSDESVNANHQQQDPDSASANTNKDDDTKLDNTSTISTKSTTSADLKPELHKTFRSKTVRGSDGATIATSSAFTSAGIDRNDDVVDYDNYRDDEYEYEDTND